MTKFNTFYLIVFSVGIALWFMSNRFKQDIASFYGIAETKPTEVSRNYDFLVDAIYIVPGQSVSKGQKLLDISIIRSEDKLPQQDYEIDKLRADERAWTQSKSSEIQTLESDKNIRLSDLDYRINEASNQLQRKKRLLADLSSIGVGSSDFKPLEDKIISLKEEKRLLIKAFDQRKKLAASELKADLNPYTSQIARLRAEKRFNEDTKVVQEEILAPNSGIIGNVFCKVGENIPSFKTLMNIYESHPSKIIGYVQEDLRLPISDQDSFRILSIKDPSVVYMGSVVNQGSRYVAIPSRFSKDPAMTLWGTEIIINIPEDNTFLQGEKVILEHLPKNKLNEAATKTEQASKLSF